MKSKLKVGFVTARSISLDGGLWTDAGVGRIVDELQNRFAEVHLAMSVSPARLPLHDHRLQLPENRFVPLPYLSGVIDGIRRGGSVRPGVAEIERRCDVVVVQLPFAAPSGLLPVRRPRVYHLCADIVEIVRSSPWYSGRRRWPARGLAHAIDLFQSRLISSSRARLIANGEELQRRFGGSAKGPAVVSATMLDAEIGSASRQRPADAPFRVLFVGYLRREKGVDTLFEACNRLRSRTTRPLELSVVGAKELEDRGMTDEVKRGLKALEGRMSVRFEGHQAFGPPLFQSFADADVLALPSLSEGTPRVLVEARAFGCPVIATRVGGIPTSVTDGVDGLLVPVSDPDALARALLRVVEEPGLHQRLSVAGVARARRHTVEAFVDSMAAEIERAGNL